jgi:hypothetical protein
MDTRHPCRWHGTGDLYGTEFEGLFTWFTPRIVPPFTLRGNPAMRGGCTKPLRWTGDVLVRLESNAAGRARQ